MSTSYAFVGPLGSGKSTVSRAFAPNIGAKWAGFGATVREIATERGLATDRKSLQDLGAVLVREETEAFCRRVLGIGERGLDTAVVVDGLRHRTILDTIRVLIHPQPIRCVFVDCPLNIRLARLRERDHLSPAQVAELERHSTEVEVEELRQFADRVVMNAGSLQAGLANLTVWAKQPHL